MATQCALALDGLTGRPVIAGVLFRVFFTGESGHLTCQVQKRGRPNTMAKYYAVKRGRNVPVGN